MYIISEAYIGYISGIFRHILGIFNIYGISHVYLRHILGISQTFLRYISGMHQAYLRYILGIYQVYFRQISDIVPLYLPLWYLSLWKHTINWQRGSTVAQLILWPQKDQRWKWQSFSIDYENHYLQDQGEKVWIYIG